MEYLEPFIKIMIINLILSGDNAVVIAMASRNLREDLKRKAVVWGTAGAVLFRILFTVIVIFLLKLPFIHLISGILLLLVAYKLLVDDVIDEKHAKVGNTLRESIAIIIFADVLMSLDNVLGIVAVSDNNMLLVIIGIILSIPIMLFASQFILHLMENYPIVVYFGAGLLAWTAGEMMLKEHVIQVHLISSGLPKTVLLAAIIAGVLSIGRLRRQRLFG